MNQDNMHTINPEFCAKEIVRDIRCGRATKEQGYQALINLLLNACGVSVDKLL